MSSSQMTTFCSFGDTFKKDKNRVSCHSLVGIGTKFGIELYSLLSDSVTLSGFSITNGTLKG